MSSGSISFREPGTATDTCNGRPLEIGGLYQRAWSGDDRQPGEPPGTPHRYDGYHVYNRGHVLKETYLGGTFYGSCKEPFTPSVQMFWDQNDELALINKLAEEINQHDWNALVFAGEIGKTVDQIANTARKLAQAAILTKKGRVHDAAKLLGTTWKEPEYWRNKRGRIRRTRRTANDVVLARSPVYDWLALRYGWRPLCSDIYNLFKALENNPKPQKREIRVQRWKPFLYGSQYNLGGVLSWDGVDRSGGWIKGRYTKRIIAKYTQPFQTLPQYFGMYDPRLVLWELLPWSFVIDWFIPVGTWIENCVALDKTANWSPQYVTTVYQRWSAGFDGYREGADPSAYVYTRYTYVGVFQRYGIVSRRVSTSLDVPKPVVRNPSIRGLRALDALALMYSAVRGLAS